MTVTTVNMIVRGYLLIDKTLSLPLRQTAHLILRPTLKDISEARSLLLEKGNYTFLAISLSNSSAFLQEGCILIPVPGARLVNPFGP